MHAVASRSGGCCAGALRCVTGAVVSSTWSGGSFSDRDFGFVQEASIAFNERRAGWGQLHVYGATDGDAVAKARAWATRVRPVCTLVLAATSTESLEELEHVAKVRMH